MDIKGTFEISVGGSELPGKSIDLFIRRVHQRILTLDVEAKFDQRSFARLRYNITWYGVPVRIELIDSIHKSVIRYANEYLENWEYGIKLSYLEKKGG